MSSKLARVEINAENPKAAAEATIEQLGSVLEQHADTKSATDRKIAQLEDENRALLESNVRQQAEIERLETEVRNLSSRNSQNSIDSLQEDDDRKAELLGQISELEAEIEALSLENQDLRRSQPRVRRIPEYPTEDDFEGTADALDWAEQEIIRIDDEAGRREGRLKAQLTRLQAKLQSTNAANGNYEILQKQLTSAQNRNATLERDVQTLRIEKDKLVSLLEAIKKSIAARSKAKDGQNSKSSTKVKTKAKPAKSRRTESEQPSMEVKSETSNYPNPLKSIKSFADNNQ